MVVKGLIVFCVIFIVLAGVFAVDIVATTTYTAKMVYARDGVLHVVVDNGNVLEVSTLSYDSSIQKGKVVLEEISTGLGFIKWNNVKVTLPDVVLYMEGRISEQRIST